MTAAVPGVVTSATVAVPVVPSWWMATEAAAMARVIASRGSAPAARLAARLAVTQSPAPTMSIGPRTGHERYFWFVETLVYTLLGALALLAVPLIDRWERRAPFAFALGLVAIALLSRFDIVDPGLPKPPPVFWLFALGWAAALTLVFAPLAIRAYRHRI